MRVYACGGAACNIAAQIEKVLGGTTKPGFADTKVVFIDTSTSNLSRVDDASQKYLFEGLDGSGKIRKENHAVITERVHDILLQHPSGDVNVVISSIAGGSGSVIAPVLVSELLARGENVIVLSIASTDSKIEIDNSIKTLKSYESIAKLRSVPVVMLHYQNSSETPRDKVNAAAVGDTVRIAALYSGKNIELDSADLKNWNNYTRVVQDSTAKLVSLKFADGKVNVGKSNILTVATVAYEGMDTSVGVAVDYQCVGFVPDECKDSIKLTECTHYLVVDGPVAEVYQELSSTLAKQEEAALARKRSQPSIVSANDNIQEDGLVL